MHVWRAGMIEVLEQKDLLIPIYELDLLSIRVGNGTYLLLTNNHTQRRNSTGGNSK